MFRRGEGEERHEQGQDRGPIQPTEVRMKDQGSAGSGSEVTVVGKGARLEGNLVSAGSLRIDGQVKGKITAEGDVVLSPQSEVDAEIRATNVVVGGAFKGNIEASNRTELSKGGKVDGNVTTKVLVVAEGASFTGESIMDGRTPSKAGASSATPSAESARPAGEAAQAQPARSS
jgi:cytoskeletal protein CcmA (bactofilin family)